MSRRWAKQIECKQIIKYTTKKHIDRLRFFDCNRLVKKIK